MLSRATEFSAVASYTTAPQPSREAQQPGVNMWPVSSQPSIELGPPRLAFLSQFHVLN